MNLEQNTRAILEESAEMLDTFIVSANMEIKDEPRLRVYKEWKEKYDILIIRWAAENIVLFFGFLFVLIFLWRTEFTYEVTGAFKVFATFALAVTVRRVHSMDSVTHADDVAKAIEKYINHNPDYFIFLEEDTNGGLHDEQQKAD